jgi:hydrogenase nickel incorporation protein HypA/HybF
MHEFAIAEGILEIINQETLAYGEVSVLNVKVRIGKLSGIMPDSLTFAFAALSNGTVADGANLLIEEVPLSITCNKCGKTSSVDNPFMICPECKCSDVWMASGRELDVTGLEIDDGNQGSEEHS